MHPELILFSDEKKEQKCKQQEAEEAQHQQHFFLRVIHNSKLTDI